MKMPRIMLILLLLPAYLMAAPPAKVDFYQGSLKKAESMAAAEGKLYFVQFTASWCMPCRWMDETTYTNPQVVNYVDRNYIPVKVDIDDFDGYAYKQQYNVQVLPTILVFDSKGKVLGKYEESLPATKLLSILKKHDQPEHRQRTAAAVVPKKRPTPAESHSPIVKQPTQSTRPAPPQVDRPVPVSEPSTNTPPTAEPAPSGEGLYRFEVMHQPSEGFSVQIGAFGEYGNVLREVAKLRERFDAPIIVHVDRLQSRTVYKILLGNFSDRQSALGYQAKMKRKGVEGIIKDLSTMK